jgi:hypothetical protein
MLTIFVHDIFQHCPLVGLQKPFKKKRQVTHTAPKSNPHILLNTNPYTPDSKGITVIANHKVVITL